MHIQREQFRVHSGRGERTTYSIKMRISLSLRRALRRIDSIVAAFLGQYYIVG